MDGVAILSKKGGISSIKGIRGLGEYAQDSKNREETGEFKGDWKEKSLPGAKYYLASRWNDFEDQFCWGGSDKNLEEIVTKMKLRYPVGHPKAGEIIKYEDVDITNMEDPFFTHDKLMSQRYMEGGRALLNPKSPVDKFYYYTYLGDPRTDKGDETNSYIKAGALFELTHPTKIQQKKGKSVEASLEASAILYNMEYEKQVRILEIMDVPGVDLKVLKDPEAVKISLGDQVINNKEIVGRYGKKSYQDRFLELAKMDPDDLALLRNVMKAKTYGIIRLRKTHALVNGEKIDGVVNEIKLMNYYLDVNNQEDYRKLMIALEDRENAK